MVVEFEVLKDEVKPFLIEFTRKFPAALKDSMSYVAAKTRKRMVAQFKVGHAGRHLAPPKKVLSDSARSRIEDAKKRLGDAAKHTRPNPIRFHGTNGAKIQPPYKWVKFVNPKNTNSVFIGFRGRSKLLAGSFMAGEILKNGNKVSNILVTQKMRRYFAAIGNPLKKSTTKINLPKYPAINYFGESMRDEPKKDLIFKLIQKFKDMTNA